MNPIQINNYPVNSYDCQAFINQRWFTKLDISQYYKNKLGRSTINDEIIQELVTKLSKFPNIRFKRNKKGYFSYEPLYVGYRAYNLIWDYEEEATDQTLTIINCYRERQFDIKSHNYYEQ